MGVIPMKLVHGALNAMSTIAKYYVDNPIDKDVIKSAKRYKKILRPFGKTVTHLSKLKEMGVIPMKLVHGALNAMNTIVKYYVDNPIEKDVVKSAKRSKRILKHFGKIVTHLSKLKDIPILPTMAISSVVKALSDITNFYNSTKLRKNINEKTAIIEFIVNKFANMSTNINELANIKTMNIKAVELNLKSMKLITRFLKRKSLNRFEIRKAEKTLTLLKNMSSVMLDLSNLNQSNISSVGESISNTLSGVNNVDMDRVESVTNMFEAFNSINKSKNVINKFTESVKEFTTTCKKLIDTMNLNTDAINGIDGGIGNSSTNVITNNNILENNLNNNTNNSIRIANVDEIAKTIAEHINGTLSIDIPDTQVQLLINGTGGNEWTITSY
jgi:hypothetical protein